MQKCLYLLCPSDCLETIINDTFQEENYFYTSLGNSFISNSEAIQDIQFVVQKYNIQKICFVLASDNKIVNDALGRQQFSDIKELSSFYSEIIKYKEQSKIVWQKDKDNLKFSVISYYLNKKIKILKTGFNNFHKYPVTISGKIYFRRNSMFTPIYSDWICLEKHLLN